MLHVTPHHTNVTVGTVNYSVSKAGSSRKLLSYCNHLHIFLPPIIFNKHK